MHALVGAAAAQLGVEAIAAMGTDRTGARNAGAAAVVAMAPVVAAASAVRARGWRRPFRATLAAGQVITGVAAIRAITTTAAPPPDEPYHYRHFGPRAVSDGRLVAPVAGSVVSDVTLTTPDGGRVRLRDLTRDVPLVLEVGSLSCPQFRAKQAAMDDLRRRYDGRARFAVLYAREAHPGPRIPPVDDDRRRRQHARSLVAAGEQRTVVIDALDGRLHRELFAGFPDAVLVVGTDGVITYRSEWNEPARTTAALEALLAAGGRGAAVRARERMHNLTPPTQLPRFIRWLVAPGWTALADFVVTIPRMALHRLRTGGFASMVTDDAGVQERVGAPTPGVSRGAAADGADSRSATAVAGALA